MLALDQIGYPVVGLLGVWGAFEARPKNDQGRKFGKKKLHADLAEIAKAGANIVFAFDSDAVDNRQVQLAECHSAEALVKAGANVTIARIPQIGAGKTGVDDFLVHHGADGPAKLKEIIAAAKPAEMPAKPSPIDIARELIADQFSHQGQTTLVFHRDNYYRWDGSGYRQIDKGELVPRTQSWLDLNGFAATSTHAKEIVASLQALALQPFAMAPPFYVACYPDDRLFPPNETIVGRNMMLSLASLNTDEPLTRAPHPGLFNVNALDYDIDLNAPQPRKFCEFIKALWPNDPKSIETLLEWMGYLLTSDTSQQKMLMTVGPRRSGKGTIARVIRSVVGEENCVSPTLASLATQFGMSPLLNKSGAIISDARLSGRTDQSIVTERLLSITGEDAQTIDRKHQSAVTTKLSTRFSIFTNELPRISESSGALTGRMIILRLRESFYGNEDLRLTDKLLAERSGILRMAIDGLIRLRKRGRFVQPDSGKELVEQLEEITSPVGAFIADRCELTAGAEVSVQALFDSWRNWCDSSGRSWTGDIQNFARDFRAAMPDIETTRPRTEAGRERRYLGIRLVN